MKNSANKKLRVKLSTCFKPGDDVPSTGIYRIEHVEHRLMHEATLKSGMKFPQCKQCGKGVSFTLVREIRGEVIPFRSGAILEDYKGPRAA